jgi:hypothetical protein
MNKIIITAVFGSKISADLFTGRCDHSEFVVSPYCISMPQVVKTMRPACLTSV